MVDNRLARQRVQREMLEPVVVIADMVRPRQEWGTEDEHQDNQERDCVPVASPMAKQLRSQQRGHRR